MLERALLLLLLRIAIAGLTKHDTRLTCFLTKDEVQEWSQEGDHPDDDKPEQFTYWRMVILEDHDCFDDMAQHGYENDNEKQQRIKNTTSIT
jgi:hypothetical protein